MEEWLEQWQEGMDSINEASVNLERYKHNLAVIAERLDALDALLKQQAPHHHLPKRRVMPSSNKINKE